MYEAGDEALDLMKRALSSYLSLSEAFGGAIPNALHWLEVEGDDVETANVRLITSGKVNLPDGWGVRVFRMRNAPSGDDTLRAFLCCQIKAGDFYILVPSMTEWFGRPCDACGDPLSFGVFLPFGVPWPVKVKNVNIDTKTNGGSVPGVWKLGPFSYVYVTQALCQKIGSGGFLDVVHIRVIPQFNAPTN
ncbi:MAG: hypothetical protein KatS3mg054_0084 [Chloroflexus sp.]|nr:MAG: hypothetical protein KatS3mg054_0084 [Chloroflexus sp.]